MTTHYHENVPKTYIWKLRVSKAFTRTELGYFGGQTEGQKLYLLL